MKSWKVIKSFTEMKSGLRHFGHWLFAFLVLSSALGLGCASTDPENASARPWNAPKNWEHGIPTSIMQGR